MSVLPLECMNVEGNGTAPSDRKEWIDPHFAERLAIKPENNHVCIQGRKERT